MTTYSTNLALTLIGQGQEDGTWGTTTNTNLGTLLEQAISGYYQYACTGGTDTITIPNGATGVARNMYIELTGTGGGTLIVPNNRKLYFIYNNTTSGDVTVKVSGQTGVVVAHGIKKSLVCNGSDVVEAITIPSAEAAYPVGSIYMNASASTNPATLLGFGTWVAFSAGRMLVGLDSGDTSFDTLGETGGSKDATLVSHTHTASTASLTGTFYTAANNYSTTGVFSLNGSQAGNGANPQTNYQLKMDASHTHTLSTEGSSATNANLPPYIVVYMWKRTA